MLILKKSAGFTLVELMMVIAILAILITIGIPSFTTLIKNNRLTSAANNLAGAVHFARAEAVRRNLDVHVSAVEVGNPGKGLRVWFDTDEDNGFDDGEELRVLRFPAAPFVVAASDEIELSVNARGVMTGTGADNKLTITLCDDRSGSYGKQVTLLATGIMRTGSGITCGGG